MPIRVWLSAQRGIGIELLFEALAERLDREIVKHCLKIPPSHGKFRGALYQLNCIDNERYDDQGNCLLDVKMPASEWNRLVKQDEALIQGFIES
jgi:GTP-binding protein HflX